MHGAHSPLYVPAMQVSLILLDLHVLRATQPFTHWHLQDILTAACWPDKHAASKD